MNNARSKKIQNLARMGNFTSLDYLRGDKIVETNKATRYKGRKSRLRLND